MRADRWTDERGEMLGKLWADGLTAQAIADRLGGVSRSAVMGKVFRLRLDAASAAAAAAMPDDAASPDSQAQAACAARSAACEPVSAALQSSPARRRRRAKRGGSSQSAEASARPRGKSLLDLTNTSCRWPHGRPGTPSFFFCGAPEADLEQGMPYCVRHARRAYLTDEDGIETANATAAARGLRAMSSAAPARSFVWRSFVRRPAPRWR